jgi:hypothetical protein
MTLKPGREATMALTSGWGGKKSNAYRNFLAKPLGNPMRLENNIKIKLRKISR